jgi:large repetitive protein
MKSCIHKLIFSFVAALCLVTGGALEAQVNFTSGTPPNGGLNTPYPVFTFVAYDSNCGGGTFGYSATGLPANGLSVDAGGNLTGTPTASGPIDFTVKATETGCDAGQFVQLPYTVQVSSPGEYNYFLGNTNTGLAIVGGDGGTTITCTTACSEYVPLYFPDFALDNSGNFLVTTIQGASAGTNVLQFSTSSPSGPPVVVVSPAQLSPAPPYYYQIGANFTGVAVDSFGNYIVADQGNNALWLFPKAGGAATLIGTFIGSEPALTALVRIDGSGNYIVASDGNGSEMDPVINVFKFAPCVPNPVSCPATQTPNPLLLGAEGFPTGPFEGALGGFTIDQFGNYVIGDQGNTVITPVPYIAKVVPSATPNVATLYSNPNNTLLEPVSILYEPQSGNYLITDYTGPYELSNDGTGLGFLYSESGAFSAAQLTDLWGGLVLPRPPVAVVAPPAPIPTAPIPTFTFTGGVLPGAFADEPYSASVSASGGVQPYSYSGSGAPAGIGVSQYGAITGTTTQTGNFSISVTATDGRGVQGSAVFTLTVAAPPPVGFSGGTLTATIVGTPVSVALAASGGAPPYTYAFVAGLLPNGLTVQSSGTLRGTPTRAGSYTFSVRATDTTGGSAVGSFSISILTPPLTLSAPSPLASGMATVGYPVQTISVSGGVAPYTFAVTTGSLPAGLTLSATGGISGTPTTAGTSSFTVTATDSSTPASTGTVSLSITVRPFSADLILSSGSVSFLLASGTTVLPAAQSVQVASTDVTQTIGYTVVVSPASATWLGVSPAAGSTPGSVSLSLTSAALSLAGSATPYQASVAVTCTTGTCNGNTQTVGVSLTVTSLPPQLTVVGGLLAFNTMSSTPQPTTQTLNIENSGGGSIGFASITCGAPWCTVSGVPGSLGAGLEAQLSVTADPTGLSSGYYYTDLSILSSAGSDNIPVTFQIASNGVLTLAPAGAEFALPQGGAALGDTTFLVTVTGSSPVSFTAAVQPGAPWLSVLHGSGSASGTQPATVSFEFIAPTVAALAPGAYYGTIQVTSSGAQNSPQSFEVVLNVTPPTQPSTPDPVPGGLIFLTQAAAGTVPAQTVTVYSGSPTTTNYQASASTNSGGSWLSVSPTTGSTSSVTAAQSSVSVDPSMLGPGVYTGAVNFAFSATAVRSVNVTLVVEATASATASAVSFSGAHPAAAISCTATQIVATSTSLVSNFGAPAGWPQELEVNLVDDCGSPIGTGQIVATFSNGDPPLALSVADPTMGNYIATWTPRSAAAQVAINARATAQGLPAVTIEIAGAVTPNNAPILDQSSIANFFNPIGGAPLAPGTLVQITGQYLAGQSLTDTVIPLPTILGGTMVIIGGLEAPISSVSPGQINAQVPFELPAGQPYQVIVSANNALTTPQSFQAGAASPGLSVLPNGYVQASHGDGSAVTDAAPAAPGENVAIYLVGLGATTIPVSSGAPGPGAPYASTSTAPVITLNNETTTFTFAGLIPGLVGVYQVNLVIPQDAINGDLVLSLSENGAASNTGLLPVHN